MKLLLVSLYWPPAGGGGVQRPLKFAQYLPALGIETHVLAPDDAKWIHSDPDLVLPTQAWIHRARYLGPRSRKLADELHGRQGLDRLSRQARSLSRRVLVPDENVGWNLTAIPAACWSIPKAAARRCRWRRWPGSSWPARPGSRSGAICSAPSRSARAIPA